VHHGRCHYGWVLWRDVVLVEYLLGSHVVILDLEVAPDGHELQTRVDRLFLACPTRGHLRLCLLVHGQAGQS